MVGSIRWFLLAALLFPATAVMARDDDTNTVEVAILDILLERGIIDAATYEELMGLAETESQKARELDLLEARLRRMQAPDISASGGKPGKFKVESEDGQWSMGFKGRLQIQADVNEGESGNRAADETNISLRRGRLALFGKAGGDNTTYKIEFDAATQNSVNKDAKSFSLTDAWVNWGLGDGMNVKAGQVKVPFGREVHMVSSRLNTVDGSRATRVFTPDREPGLMFYGATEDKFIEYYAGVFNGEGTNISNASGETGSGASGLRYGGRVVVNPLGEVKKDVSSFQTVEDGSTRLAIGASVMRNDDQAQDVDGDGTAGDSRSSDTSMGFEAQLLTGPVSVLSEYFSRRMDIAGAPNQTDRGYNAQVGVMVVPNKYEVVFRRSEVNFDVASDMLESTLALVRYSDKHNSKFTFDVTKVVNKSAGKKDEMQYRGQYQVIF